MNRTDKNSNAGARPTTASPAVAERKHRPDLEPGFFGVMWPMPPGMPVPGLTRRAGAFALDMLVASPLLPLSIAFTEIVSGGNLLRFDALVRSGLTFVLLLAIHFAAWESSPARATPGKIMLDLRVTTAGGEPLRFADAMLRFWLRVATVLTANVGLCFAWSDARGRALHDRWAGSFVIAHYVTPGELRRVGRGSRRGDLAIALTACALAYFGVFTWAPAFVRDVRVADRFELALVELTPVLAKGELLDEQGRWAAPLREASAALDELQLDADVENGASLVLRARGEPALHPARDTAYEVRLERSAAASWSCTRRGLAFYAAPRRCTELSTDGPVDVAGDAAANPG